MDKTEIQEDDNRQRLGKEKKNQRKSLKYLEK